MDIPSTFQNNWEKQKKNEEKSGIFTQNQFLLIGVVLKMKTYCIKY